MTATQRMAQEGTFMTTEQLVDAFTQALCSGDEARARDVVNRAREAGFEPTQVYFEIFAPSMVMIGELWERNQLSVAEEHLATAITERLIGELSPLFSQASTRSHRAILGCVQGENHTLGLRMLADVFQRHGWRTLYLGANVPSDDWVRLVQRTAADAVAISVNSQRNLSEAQALVERLRSACPSLRITVGGAAFDQNPQAWHDVGADVYDRNPEAAIRTLDAFFVPASQPHP